MGGFNYGTGPKLIVRNAWDNIGAASIGDPVVQDSLFTNKIFANEQVGFSSIAYANGKYVAFTNQSSWANYTSTDGINWSWQHGTNDNTARTWISAAYGAGVFVAVASGAGSTYAISSTDGIDWTKRTLPAANWLSVIYANGTFVAVSDSTVGATSTDGITWTSRTLSYILASIGLAYGNGMFVTVGSGSAAQSSPDGITWTLRWINSIGSWRALAYGNGLFIAVGDSGGMAIGNGTVWTLLPIVAAVNWISVTFGRGMFVAFSSNSSYVALSQDGINWKLRNCGVSPSGSRAAIFANGVFLASSSGPTGIISNPNAKEIVYVA